jgi:branched-chain amino acid transport system permease protein
MKLQTLRKPELVIPGALLIIFILLPLWLKEHPYWMHIVIYTLWWIYMTTCWAISGMTRMYSFIHTAFIGAGAYVSTLLFLHFNLTPWLGMLAGMFIAIIIATIIGWVGARFGMSPLSFVILCLAMAFALIVIVCATDSLGSEEGLFVFYTESNPAMWQFMSKVPHYFIILAMVVGIILANRAILRSKLGLYFKAIYDNERAAAAAGVDIVKYKILALAISAALIAPAGTFWAQYSRFVNPEGVLTYVINILLILYAAVGGLHTLWGPVVAPAIFAPLTEVVRGYLPMRFAGANLIIVGLVALFIIMYMPRGIVPRIQTWQAQRREARLAAASSASEAKER